MKLLHLLKFMFCIFLTTKTCSSLETPRCVREDYRPVSLLSVVSKVFEKLDHLEKCGLFSDFQYGFRCSRSTTDLLTVVSDRIATAFNRSGATQAIAHDIS